MGFASAHNQVPTVASFVMSQDNQSSATLDKGQKTAKYSKKKTHTLTHTLTHTFPRFQLPPSPSKRTTHFLPLLNLTKSQP